MSRTKETSRLLSVLLLSGGLMLPTIRVYAKNVQASDAVTNSIQIDNCKIYPDQTLSMVLHTPNMIPGITIGEEINGKAINIQTLRHLVLECDGIYYIAYKNGIFEKSEQPNSENYNWNITGIGKVEGNKDTGYHLKELEGNERDELFLNDNVRKAILVKLSEHQSPPATPITQIEHR
ncbi:MAG: hypothetical protein ABR981_02570 [Candidatus Micrarchaeaceae archaeon]|jgi:hypothetical protein